MTVKVRVPATSANLGPGYDSIGLALQIYNELTLSVAEGKQSTVEIGGALPLPRDGSHLLKAADLLLREPVRSPAWRLHQHNRVLPLRPRLQRGGHSGRAFCSQCFCPGLSAVSSLNLGGAEAS